MLPCLRECVPILWESLDVPHLRSIARLERRLREGLLEDSYQPEHGVVGSHLNCALHTKSPGTTAATAFIGFAKATPWAPCGSGGSALGGSQAHSRAHATRPVGGQPGAYSCCVLRCRLIHAHQLDRRRSSKRRRVAGCVLATLLLSEKRPRLMLQSLAATSGPLATGALTEPLLGHVAEDVAHARRVELDRRMTQLIGGALDLLPTGRQVACMRPWRRSARCRSPRPWP